MPFDRPPPSGALPFSRSSPALRALFLCVCLLAAAALLGLALDPRSITGAPAWLKPLKFAISTALYALSFPWLLDHLDASARARRLLAGITAGALFLELGLIFLQAARGVGSHFNVDSPLNAIIFGVMGVTIAALWAAQLATAVLLCRQRFEDPALGWALRLGMGVTALGAAVGWLMVQPTAAQREAFRHGLVVLNGAHTVGAPDGGAGFPFTDWSRSHGDLRAAHFLGLHALQAIPLFALGMGKLRSLTTGQRARLVLSFGASYSLLVALLLWQALRGESIGAPGAATQIALCVWLVLSLGLAAFSAARPARALAEGP